VGKKSLLEGGKKSRFRLPGSRFSKRSRAAGGDCERIRAGEGESARERKRRIVVKSTSGKEFIVSDVHRGRQRKKGTSRVHCERRNRGKKGRQSPQTGGKREEIEETSGEEEKDRFRLKRTSANCWGKKSLCRRKGAVHNQFWRGGRVTKRWARRMGVGRGRRGGLVPIIWSGGGEGAAKKEKPYHITSRQRSVPPNTSRLPHEGNKPLGQKNRRGGGW